MFTRNYISLKVKKKLLLSSLLTVVLSPTASLFADDSEGFGNDDNVIVVLGKIPRPMSDVLGAVSVITSETIEQNLVHDIADLVRYQSGVSIENSGTRFGLSGFSIRGLGGNRVTTEIDGIPVASQFDIGSYSNSGRNFIDTDMIQQVEILKGPASSIYGSNAIGGVISYITKKPTDYLSKTNNNTYIGLKAGYYGVDTSQLLSAKTAFGNEKSSALLSVTKRKGHEFENQADVDSAIDFQDNESLSIMAKYYYAPSLNHEFSISYDFFERQAQTDIHSFLGQGRFRSTTGLIGDDESKRQNISLNYQFQVDQTWLSGGVIRLFDQQSDVQQLSIENRLSRGQSQLYNRDFFYQQDIQGVRVNFYTYQSTTNTEHTIGYGVEYSKSTVVESRNTLLTNLDTGAVTNVILSEVFPLRDFPISKITNSGFYINDEIALTGTAWTIIPAIRFDRYQLSPREDELYLINNPTSEIVSITESSVSPKLAAEYEFSEQVKLYFQYARGFRAPPFEDANIGLDIPLFQLRAIANPDLKSETSDGYEIGLNISNNAHHFSSVAFYTDYQDFILTKVNLGFDPVSGRVLFQSQNVDEAKIYGLELSYQYEMGSWLSPDDSLSLYSHVFWSKGSNKDTSEPLNSIEPSNILFGISYLSADSQLRLALQGAVYEAKDNVDEPLDDELFKTKGYATFDLTATYQLNEQMDISLAINNLTDRKFWKWSDVNGMLLDDPILATLSSAGRNASVQINIHW